MAQLLWQLASKAFYFGPAIFLAGLGARLLPTGRFPPIIPLRSVRRPRQRGTAGLSGGLAMVWLGLRYGLPRGRRHAAATTGGFTM
uniref:Uncharacterized protein n=1 Tax=Thermorudis peleae TaxID=1382356 RepID=A0A831TF35_9BACT